MNTITQSKKTVLPRLIILTLVSFALSPAAEATCREGCDIFNHNTFLGNGALTNNSTGSDNTAIGNQALYFNQTGSYNTATGSLALVNNKIGSYNTASGWGALGNNTDGINNTASGYQALVQNTEGGLNTATGYQALFSNVNGSKNTAMGFQALYTNSGIQNTGIGYRALYSNTNGTNNTATGLDALLQSNGNQNTADGVAALHDNTTGNYNTANGYQALYSNQAGSNNTANGSNALLHNTGNNNIAVGSSAGINLTTGNNNINIGAPGVAGESGKIRIGTKGTHTGTFIAGIAGKTVANGVGVLINANGQLGTIQSSARYKDDIKPMDKASEGILALKPVTFRYKEELDPEKIPQFGLIAEEVAKVSPDLVVRDEEGKLITVRYEAVNAMLLNEFLKEHKQVQDLKGTVAQQQDQIEALAAIVQKVTAQLELSKASAQLANN